MLKICRKPFILGSSPHLVTKERLKPGSVEASALQMCNKNKTCACQAIKDQNTRYMFVTKAKEIKFLTLPQFLGIEFRFLLHRVITNIPQSTLDDSWMLFYGQSGKCLSSPANQRHAAMCLCVTLFSLLSARHVSLVIYKWRNDCEHINNPFFFSFFFL